MKFRFLIAIVVVLIVSSVIIGTSVLNDSRSVKPPPHLIVLTTPEVYMEVNTFNLSTVSEVYSLSFCALRGIGSANMSMNLIELKVSNGSTVGTLHFGDNTSQYTLNMAGSSMFTVNVYGGYVFTDSTAITLKYKGGPIQNLTSIDLVDLADGQVLG